MKKAVKKLMGGVFVSIVVLAQILSCKNFMQGEDELNQIKESIDYLNAPFAKIEITSDGVATQSLVPAAGNYNDKYKAGDTFEVKFEEQSTYRFVCWQSIPEGSVTFSNEGTERTATVTINNVDEPIIISPYAVLRDKLQVSFAWEQGVVSGPSENSFYLDDVFTFRYTEDSNYAFVEWIITDNKTGDVVDDAIELVQNGNEVIAKVLRTDLSITIKAVATKRPRIVSATPLYDTEGVYRDRRITIMFDTTLSKDSIYYTREELVELGIWDTATNSVKTGYKLLDKNGDKKYFGYQKIGDDNSIVWKIISITKRSDESVNLLSCYECPEFDMNDTSVLRISSNTDVTKMPPVTTDILVTVKMTFGINAKCINGDKKVISLNNTYVWNYFTNSLYDNEKPVISELALYNVKKDDKDFETDISDNEKLYDEDVNERRENTIKIIDNIENDGTKIAAYNLSEGKLWIKAQITDGGSGPKALSATVAKVPNKYYPCPDVDSDGIKKIEGFVYTAKLSVAGSIGNVYSDIKCNGEILDVSSLDDGLYKITFTAIDKNDLTSSKEAYFIYDKTGPKLLSEGSITNLRTELDSESVSWSENPTGVGAEDFDHIEVECWDGENQIDETKKQTDLNTKTFSFTGLKDRKPYEYRFYSVDYAGNRSSAYIVYKDSTPSNKKVTEITNSRTSADKETLTWENPGDDVDYLMIERCLDGKVEDTFTQDFENNNKETTKTFENLTNQKKYEYRFYTVDYSGNKSTTCYTHKDNTGPTSLTSNCAGSRIKATEETVNWTNPTGDDVDHIEIDCYYNDNTTKKTTFVQSPANKVTTNKFTGLTNQTKYTYRFYSVDYSGNRSATYSTHVDNIGPALPENVIAGSLNTGIRLIFDVPSGDNQYDHINISGADTKDIYLSAGEHHTVKFIGKTNGNSYAYNVSAVDFAGNKSTVTVTEKAGIKAGDYCYLKNNRDIYFSNSVKEDDTNIVGIVISNGYYSTNYITTEAVRVLDINMYKPETSYVVYKHSYGKVTGVIDNIRDDGLIMYNNVNKYNLYDRCPKIEYLYQNRNNYDKNPIIWYLPSLNELLQLNGYNGDGFCGWIQKTKVNASLSQIPSTITHMSALPNSGEFASSTLVNSGNTPMGYTVYWSKGDYYNYTLSGNEWISYADCLLMAQINPAY